MPRVKVPEELKGVSCTREVSTHDGWYTSHVRCGRPAKGYLKNGKPACGIHLNTERQRTERDYIENERQDRRQTLKQRVAEFCEESGLEVSVGSYKEMRVLIDLDVLNELYRKAEGENDKP